MQNLAAFLAKNFHWLLFLVLEVASVMLLLRYNSFQGSVWVSSANTVTGKVYEWQSSVEQFFSLRQRANELTQQNIDLEQKLWRARQRLLDITTDTMAVDSTIREMIPRLKTMPARVVSNTIDRRDNLITIDRGSSDGVRPDMGVICGMGLVGVVYMVSSHYSMVIPVLNVHSHISCAFRNSGYFGYLVWDGKRPTEAYLEDVPRHAPVKVGEIVETSGYSAIFPPGITVGTVADIGNSADGLSYSLKVKLSTDFSCLRDVCIITDTDFPEEIRLITAARDSMAQTRGQMQ